MLNRHCESLYSITIVYDLLDVVDGDLHKKLPFSRTEILGFIHLTGWGAEGDIFESIHTGKNNQTTAEKQRADSFHYLTKNAWWQGHT